MPVEVTVDLEGHEVVAGMLHVYERHGQSTTFEYSEDYLRDPRAYDLEPALPRGSGSSGHLSARALFNVFADTAGPLGPVPLARQEARPGLAGCQRGATEPRVG